MSFFNGFKTMFAIKLIDDIFYNPDIYEIIDEFSQVVIMGNTSRKYYTLKEMMNWFSEQLDENPNAHYAFARIKKTTNGNINIVLCLLDQNNKVFFNKNNVVAIKIETKEIDEDLVETFKKSDSIVFN